LSSLTELRCPKTGNFTFGFVNALVDSSGAPVVASQGVVDFDVPAEGGPGVGGAATTNN
jgi:hypothetical protein